MTESLLRTPLYNVHLELGGRLVEFAGWEMPVQFAGIIEEHVHTRSACSLFDVSHMGRLKVTGKNCESFLNRLCTRNLAGAEPGRCYYTHMCREDGGVLDDLIVSRFESHWGIVCNGANRQKIVSWLDRQRSGTDVRIQDETTTTAMVAIQGPKTLDVAQGLVDTDVSSIKRYHFRVFEFLGAQIAVYRTGYTGEDGLEVVVPAWMTKMVVPRILGTKDSPHPVVRPAGLGARDTLRIEASMPLYGHELTEEVDSLTAGQSWCVDLSKDFVGAEPMRKLKQAGLPRVLAGLEVEGRRIARQHGKLYACGRDVGEVTSGTLSPTLGKSIAMGFVKTELAAEGTSLEVEVGNRRTPAKVVKMPFYKRPKQL